MPDYHRSRVDCLLPDHLRCIWKLPDMDADHSIRWKVIKDLATAVLGAYDSRPYGLCTVDWE